MKTSRYLVTPGTPISLQDYDPDDTGPFKDKDEGKDYADEQRGRLSELQERLYAEGKQSLLVVFQATDTGGKDSSIRKLFTGLNPQGVRVNSFKVPSHREAAHDFLWRYHRATPAKGMIGVFNRSHYEEVLVVRVKELVEESVWQKHYEHINNFEKLLADSGTKIVKFYLHISRDEQKERLQDRLDDPTKHWKFNVADLADRKLWSFYQDAFQDALNRCSTDYAPWYIVPANRKWFRDALIAKVVADTLEEMNPQFPEQTEDLSEVVIPD